MATNNSINYQGILLGLAVGGLIAGSSMLLTSRTGKRLKRNLVGKYHDVRSNIDEFIEALNDNVIKNLDKKSALLSKKVKKAVEYVRDEIDTFSDAKHPEFRNGILMGAIAGGVLGIGFLLVLQNQFEGEGAEDFVKKIGNKASSWRKNLEDVLEAFEEQTHFSNGSSHSKSPVSDAINFASAGYKLWNDMRSK
jgi:gas vesicle protein